jgi:hypothetical protein
MSVPRIRKRSSFESVGPTESDGFFALQPRPRETLSFLYWSTLRFLPRRKLKYSVTFRYVFISPVRSGRRRVGDLIRSNGVPATASLSVRLVEKIFSPAERRVLRYPGKEILRTAPSYLSFLLGRHLRLHHPRRAQAFPCRITAAIEPRIRWSACPSGATKSTTIRSRNGFAMLALLNPMLRLVSSRLDFVGTRISLTTDARRRRSSLHSSRRHARSGRSVADARGALGHGTTCCDLGHVFDVVPLDLKPRMSNAAQSRPRMLDTQRSVPSNL